MSKRRVFCTLAASLAVSFAIYPRSLNAATLCPFGNATLHGTYIVSGSGTVGGAPIAAVGEITWDGQGNTTATYTASLGGAIHKGVTVTGTYHINPDCTGTHSESDDSHYDFVAAPNGSGTTWISTDSGAVITGTTVRLKPVESEEAKLHIRAEDKHVAPANLRRGSKSTANLRLKRVAVTQQLGPVKLKDDSSRAELSPS